MLQGKKGPHFFILSAFVVFIAIGPAMLTSCSRLLGWGVVLWNVETPAIPSGTLVPVYIKSNIDNVYVIGVPKEYQVLPEKKSDPVVDKVEVPLWQIQYFPSKSKATEYSKAFSDYAPLYAETLQDGLPIRSDPDNSARRVYRLRQGQVIKVLDKAEGNPAMSGSSPLPGDWLKVLTEDGAIGYCFSYRLRIFEIEAGLNVAVAPQNSAIPEEDRVLESVLSKNWYPDWYKDMVDNQTIDLDSLTAQWGFFPNQDTGIIHLALPDFDKTYSYSSITKVDTNSWRFEGTTLQITLRDENLLAVQYQVTGGAQKTSLFVALSTPVNDIIAQEKERRLVLLRAIAQQGPTFQSENYGRLSFSDTGSFTWDGYDLLVPQIIPATVRGTGTIAMRLFIREALRATYDGAFTLYFNPRSALQGGSENTAAAGANGPTLDSTAINFLYKVEPSGLRLEYLPPSTIDGNMVLQRSSSPIIMYFPRLEQ